MGPGVKTLHLKNKKINLPTTPQQKRNNFSPAKAEARR